MFESNNTYVFPGTYSALLSITDEFGCTSDTVLIDFLTIEDLCIAKSLCNLEEPVNSALKLVPR